MPLAIESLLISNISFCNKEASNIRCNDFKKKMIEYLDNKYQIKINNKDFVKINPNILQNNLFVILETPVTLPSFWLAILTPADRLPLP